MMKLIGNLKIRAKLLLAFGLVIVMVMILSTCAITALSTIDSGYSELLAYPQKRLDSMNTLKYNIADFRRTVAMMGVYSGRSDKIDGFESQGETAYNACITTIDDYIKLVNGDPDLGDADKKSRLDNMTEMKTMLGNYYNQTFKQVAQAARENDQDTMLTSIENGAANITAMVSLADERVATAQKAADDSSAQQSDAAGGNMNVNIRVRDTKDEIGELTRSFSKLSGTFVGILGAIEYMAKQHDLGEIEDFVDESAYPGSFGEVAAAVNVMVSGHINTKRKAMACINQIVEGDFNAPMEQLPRKKVFINEAIEAVRAKIKGIRTEVTGLTEAALAGNLSKTIDVSKYPGDWEGLMGGLNSVMRAVADPIAEVSGSMKIVSQIIGGIAEASQEQALSISQIDIGLSQISQVVQAPVVFSDPQQMRRLLLSTDCA